MQEESITSTPQGELSLLVKEQLKSCGNILRGMKRHRDAGPFLQPVDPDALGIPEYRTIISNPMDISTMASKLEQHSYATAEEFVADMRLMLSNCFTFNAVGTPVYNMGKSLERHFETAWAKVPQTDADLAALKAKASPATSVDLESPIVRRASRPASVSIPPPSSFTPSSVAMPKGDYGRCQAVLRELLKKTSQVAFSWPFVQPVDPDALGIPEYRTIVTNPMDLGTMRSKLDARAYRSAQDFESDFRLVVNNCRTFNPADSDVVRMANEMEAFFEAKWAVAASSAPASARSSASSIGSSPAHGKRARGGSVSSSGLDHLSDNDKILAINRQIQILQAELNELLMKRNSSSSSAALPPSKKTPTTPSANPQKKKKPAQADTSSASSTVVPSAAAPKDDTPLSYQEKAQLSIDVNNLPPERLPRIVEIIQASMPSLKDSADSEVIELDIESLDARTLRQLQAYVRDCNKKRKKPEAAASSAPAVQPAALVAPVDDGDGEDTD